MQPWILPGMIIHHTNFLFLRVRGGPGDEAKRSVLLCVNSPKVFEEASKEGEVNFLSFFFFLGMVFTGF